MKIIFENIARTILFSLLVSVSCVRYQALPSETEAGECAAPSPEQIQMAASRISHPMLKPVKVDLSDGLNPNEAALIAVALNPDLQVERDKAVITVSQMAAAGLLPDPLISVGSASPTGENRLGKVRGYNFGLSFNISSLLNRRFRRRAAKEVEKSVNLAVAWREWQVAMAARFQCRKVAIVGKEAGLAGHYAVFCENLQANAEDLLKSGLMTKGQVSVFEGETVKAEQESSGLNAEKYRARLRLNRLLGLPPKSAFTVSGFNQIHVRSVPSLLELNQFLPSRRPDLLALWSAVQSRDAAYRAEVWNQFPRIELGGTSGRDTDSVRTIGWGLSGALPVFNRNRGAISTSKATRKLLLDEYRARLFQARADTAKILPGLKDARNRQVMVKGALSEARTRLRDTKDAVSQGILGPEELFAAGSCVHLLAMTELRLQMEIEGLVSALETEAGLWPGTKNQRKESR
ncbi:MAG: TolC family protein [Acidobacteria bacterium]|nr:TolC family protein [Acidobacteriota bacterium]